MRNGRGPAGGGVLLDIGCHVLDMILFWFGGATIVTAMHDSFGGIEVNALATLETREGVRGTVELSWERSLRAISGVSRSSRS